MCVRVCVKEGVGGDCLFKDALVLYIRDQVHLNCFTLSFFIIYV